MNSTQRRGLGIFLAAFFIYTLPITYNALVTPFFHVIPSQDVVANSLVPASIVTRGNFYLDQYRRYIANNYVEQHFAADVNGHLVSLTPIMAGVLAVPFVGTGLGTGWVARTVYVFDVAKFSATFITALAVLAFFLAARELSDLGTATFAAVAFGFASSVWATASQGLWQHTPSVLFLSIALWFLIRGTRRGARAAVPAGLFLSLATISRPTVLPIALVCTLYVLVHLRRALIPFIVSALPPLALVLVYNTLINGSPLVFGYQDGVPLGYPHWEMLQGLLFSASRGLFVFSPFLLLAPLGLWYGWVREKKMVYPYLALAFLAYLAILVSHGSLGGWAYGPRLMTDVMPIACLLVIPVVERIQGAGRVALWGITLAAAGVQSLGLVDYGVSFHADPANSVWSIQNNEPLFYLKLYAGMIHETLGF